MEKQRRARGLPVKTPRGRDPLLPHRRAIESLDKRILELVARRLAAAEAIGAIKCERGVPLRNYEVEAQVRARLESLALGAGLEGSLGRDLALFLIERSLRTQSTMLERVYAGDRMSVVVVGGMGGMGRWIARFLNGQGHEVVVCDPAAGECPFPRVALDSAREAHLVMVAVPMDVCAQVLEALAALRPAGVVAEMCSLKGPLLAAFDGLRGRGMRLVSWHPLFGPGVRMLTGRKLVVCTEGDEGDRAVVKGLFEATSAQIVEMDSREHDRRMALVLGLTHLTNLALARALEASGVSFEELEEVAGVTFTRQMATTREVASENPDLYFEIQRLSLASGSPSDDLARAVGELADAIGKGDSASFARLMDGARRYFAASS